MAIQITSGFDAGNILVDACNDPNDIRLQIRKDNNSDFLQWFYFRAVGIAGSTNQFKIINAGDTTYPKGWENYDVVCSYDRQHWFRVPSHYDGTTLSWSLESVHDSAYFAYFAPYSHEQHCDLVAFANTCPGVTTQSLGLTLDGRDLDYLHIGPIAPTQNNTKRLSVWAIARQHPGESMASLWMEGWLQRLLDEDDATSRALRELADIHVVPNMNPDGSVRGHLRTNAAGANLNREWQEASMDKSPEVFLVRDRMHQAGVDMCIDVHGDEAIPHNFIAGTEGVSGWNDQRDQTLIDFKNNLASLNPDFQTEHGYPRNAPNSANLTFCSNYVAHTFGCPAYTLEMPFKDTANTPQPEVGWSPERSVLLGGSFVTAVYQALIRS